MNKHILVMYETAGGGHYANARAIENAFKTRHPGCTVTLMHISAATNSKRVEYLYNSYNDMLKADPRMVHYGYQIMNRVNAEQIIFPLLLKANRNLEDYLREQDPDIIVSVFGVVNYAAMSVLDRMGWTGKKPYVIFVTDLTRNFLRSWVHPEADMMIAMLDESREQLIAYGMPAERIRVLHGMPVNPTFMTQRKSREEARRALGMALDRFTVLITMGGVANKNTIRFSKELADSGLPLQLIVACGRNAALKRKMDRLASHARIPIKVLGFTDQMPTLMDASDVAVSKPGPGTIAELAYKEIPMLIDGIFAPMPQEKGNLDFVVEKGIGTVITRSSSVSAQIRDLMENPHKVERLKENMRRINNPDAVYDLVDLIANAQVADGKVPSLSDR
ncbi:MAG TPA: glycosyltransferase [Pantanalinema sp.]